MKKGCCSCICLHCNNGECFMSICKGAVIEMEFYEEVFEDCYVEKCEDFVPEKE